MSHVPAPAWDDKAEALLAKQRLDSAERKAQPCDSCGEVGRTKATDWTGGVEHVWCHDDDRSCYGYREFENVEDAIEWIFDGKKP